jgi:hypothetical protein
MPRPKFGPRALRACRRAVGAGQAALLSSLTAIMRPKRGHPDLASAAMSALGFAAKTFVARRKDLRPAHRSPRPPLHLHPGDDRSNAVVVRWWNETDYRLTAKPDDNDRPKFHLSTTCSGLYLKAFAGPIRVRSAMAAGNPGSAMCVNKGPAKSFFPRSAGRRRKRSADKCQRGYVTSDDTRRAAHCISGST